jgi:hypothetical protein
MNVNAKTARTAGLLYLIIFVAGIFAQFVVRESLIVPGDAAATADKILASEGLFRLGIASDFIMILADVAIGVMFYVLLEPVNKTLALMAAFFRLAQATTLGLNLLNLIFALQFVKRADYLAAFDAEQSNALGLMFLDGHAVGYRIGLVFFGLSILVLGYLLIKSGYFPKFLGYGLIGASAGYLTDSFAYFLLPNYADYETTLSMVVFGPAVIAELSLTLWLLFKGMNVQQKSASLRGVQAERMRA